MIKRGIKTLVIGLSYRIKKAGYPAPMRFEAAVIKLVLYINPHFKGGI